MIKVKGNINGIDIEFEGDEKDFIEVLNGLKNDNTIYIPYTPCTPYEPYNPNIDPTTGDPPMWFNNPDITCDCGDVCTCKD